MPIDFQRSAAISTLGITPLIDIVFLLLIFFLVTARFAQEDRELDVQLPTVSEAKPLIEKPQEIFINIDAEGKYFVGSQQVNDEQLKTLLQDATVQNPLHQSVILRADRRCSWERVATAIDSCHQAGIHDVRPTTSNLTPSELE